MTTQLVYPEAALAPSEPQVTSQEQHDVGIMPDHGTTLLPGVHLCELEFRRPVAEAVLEQALRRMGFENIVFDQSAGNEPGEWGSEPGAAPPVLTEEPVRYRFIANLTAPWTIRNTNDVFWIYQHALPFDPFRDFHLTLFPHELTTNKVYALRFLARMRTQPNREAVCRTLRTIRFEPIKVCALRRNMRIPGRPGASISLWYALAMWAGPQSIISEEDPLWFEDVVSL